MKTNYEFDSEMDLLASGPVIHTWEGIVHAQPKEIKFDPDTREFFFTGVWSNSYEAEQRPNSSWKPEAECHEDISIQGQRRLAA